MASRGTPIGFGIYDLLTRVAPGAIFLLIIFGSELIQTQFIPSRNVTIYLITFAVLSLVSGEAINHLATIIYLPPKPFTRFLYEQGIDVQLGWFDRMRRDRSRFSVGESNIVTAARDEFWPLFSSHLRIDSDYSNEWDIYNLLVGYMDPELSPRTQRQQTIVHFVNNTKIAIIGGVVFVLLKLGQEAITGESTGLSVVTAVLTFYVSIFLLFALSFSFGSHQSYYVSNLIREYYLDRVEAGEMEGLASRSIQTTLEQDSSEV